MILTKNDVKRYLEDVKQAIENKKYTIADREKNEELFLNYIITEKQREDILFSLKVEDFCEAVYNEKEEYKHELLYIFGKDVNLWPRISGKMKQVSL